MEEKLQVDKIRIYAYMEFFMHVQLSTHARSNPQSKAMTNITFNIISSNHRLESLSLNALEELLFRCWQ